MRLAAGLLVALLLPATARADLGGRRAGAWFDAGAGLGVADRPWTPGVGWTAAAGGWFGRYDDSFAIGRRVDVGLRVRQDVLLDDDHRVLRTAPMVEVRRGVDLLVVALRYGGTAGALLSTPLDGGGTRAVGGTVRAAGAVGWRFRPQAALLLRLDAGIDVQGRAVTPVLGLTLGLEGAFMVRRRAVPDEAVPSPPPPG